MERYEPQVGDWVKMVSPGGTRVVACGPVLGFEGYCNLVMIDDPRDKHPLTGWGYGYGPYDYTLHPMTPDEVAQACMERDG